VREDVCTVAKQQVSLALWVKGMVDVKTNFIGFVKPIIREIGWCGIKPSFFL
jgi:hypothetical protein